MADDDDAARERALHYERAINQGYLARLESQVEGSAPHLAVPRSRSASWTGSAPVHPLSRNLISPLIGRVALDHDDPDLGAGNFYIGSWHDDALPPTVVVSWAAPVAKLFFKGTEADDPRAHLVQARRSFSHRQFDLSALDDDVEPAWRRQNPFRSTETASLSVPAPPRPTRPSRLPAAASSSAPSTTEAVGETPGPAARPANTSTPTGPTRLRAEASVRRAMEAPRSRGLGSVLATMQPDQYDLVTHSHRQPLIVDGSPGTGKTIIATHRAAYLTNTDGERPDGLPLGRVAIVGPSPAWGSHVRTSIDQLADPGRVDVLDLRTMLGQLAKADPDGAGPDGDRIAWSWELSRVVDLSVAAMRRHRPNESLAAAEVVTALVKGSPSVAGVLRRYPEVADWLRSSDDWKAIRRRRSHLGLIAAVGLALGRDTGPRYDHVIVDEAQDVRPLEWKLIDHRLKNDSTWTLIGDLNQRRCDWSASSWTETIETLELDDPSIRHLTTSFRSTRQILRLANQLLPASERTNDALRDGEDPEVVRIGSTEVAREAAARGMTLARQFAPGRVAVIGQSVRRVADRVRESGWQVVRGERHTFEHNGATLSVMEHERARGLEFDAVVVTEPADFPTNLGRHGPLFTSLTRATKHLAIVHSRPLPGGLRAR